MKQKSAIVNALEFEVVKKLMTVDGISRETAKKQVLHEIMLYAQNKWHLEVKDYCGYAVFPCDGGCANSETCK